MKNYILFLITVLAVSCKTIAEEKKQPYEAIHSGVAWFDQNRKEVNAHGACIVKEGELYYLFGEYKSDTSNVFTGFSCYSSPDLINWKFERVVLSVQNEGLLGPNRVGERVKVMKCPATGEFVMYMHCDDVKYNDPHVGYAICETIDGEYQFQGDLLYEGDYLEKWDLSIFQDSNGKGYLLTHEGFIYELSSDYKSVKREVVSHVARGGESPALFKSKGRYFWMFSNKTSWERNDNYYFTATSLEGPWERKGLFTPEGTLTWNSQCSFVFPVIHGNDTLHMYMGDRWSFPKQGSAATYVWQPITVNGEEIEIPVFQESWYFDRQGQWHPVTLNLKPVTKKVQKDGAWEVINNTFTSNQKDVTLSFSFKGEQVCIKGLSDKTSGYARIVLKNSGNKEVINTIVDFYSKTTCSSTKFLSPVLEPDTYTLTIEVTGEHPFWSDKRVSHYGSTDDYIVIENILYR